MSDADVIFFPVISVQHHHPAPAKSRAEHERNKLLDIRAFEQAERLAEGARQAAFEKAAGELRALGEHKTAAAYDRHNNAVNAAEVAYLEAVIAAAARYGIIGGWKTTLATLPKPVPSAVRALGKANW
jgi:hypothetical protein